MNRKKSRFTLLIPMIAILLFLGVSVTIKLTSSTFQTSNLNFNNEEISIQLPSDYLIYEILGTEACECLGNTYSDTSPPDIVIISPLNNSLSPIDTIIYIEASDNFPAGMVGGVNLVPEFIYYHWNNDTSNTTVYNAGIDGAPPDDGPVKIELTFPNDEGNVTHVLHIYAVDYEDNWISLILLCSTHDVVVATTTTTVTTTTTTIATTTTTMTATTTTTTTVSTSLKITTEISSNITTESNPTFDITTGFSVYIILFLLIILVPIKKRKKKFE